MANIKLTKVTLSNEAAGARGVGGIFLEPGEKREVSLTDDQLAEVELFGLLKIGEAKAESGDELDKMNAEQLTKEASDLGLALPETGTGKDGKVLKADIIAAIRAATE